MESFNECAELEVYEFKEIQIRISEKSTEQFRFYLNFNYDESFDLFKRIEGYKNNFEKEMN